MKTQPLSFVSVRLALGVRRSPRRFEMRFQGGRAIDVPAGTHSDMRAIRRTRCRFCQESGAARYVSGVGGLRYLRRASSIRTT